MTTTIVLVRHGKTDYRHGKRFQGELDNGITYLEKQMLPSEYDPFAFQAAYCSDLQRATETCEAIFSLTKMPYTVSPMLREPSCGPLEGMHSAGVRLKWPEIRKMMYTDNETRMHYSYFPGLETPRDTAKRVLGYIESVIVPEHKGKRVMVVTHSQVLACIIAHINGERYANIRTTHKGDVLLKHVDGKFDIERIRGLSYDPDIGDDEYSTDASSGEDEGEENAPTKCETAVPGFDTQCIIMCFVWLCGALWCKVFF